MERRSIRSFPFPYELRKAMLESVFPKVPNLTISPDYTFFSPFIKSLTTVNFTILMDAQNKILQNIHESEFVTYTGDISENVYSKPIDFTLLKPTD